MCHELYTKMMKLHTAGYTFFDECKHKKLPSLVQQIFQIEQVCLLL